MTDEARMVVCMRPVEKIADLCSARQKPGGVVLYALFPGLAWAVTLYFYSSLIKDK